MGKEMATRITMRQLQMVSKRLLGVSYRTIGENFNITASGARTVVMDAMRIIRKHGMDAFPEDFDGSAIVIADIISFSKQTLHVEENEEEQIFTVAVTECRTGYVKIRGKSPYLAKEHARKMFEEDGKELPEMDIISPLTYSVIGVENIN